MTAKQAKRSLGAQPFLYPEPALLVATYNNDGKPNVMTAAWGGICCSDPVSLMVAVRPERLTYDAILQRKAFTVGIPSENMLAAADFAGIVSGRRHDKFSMAGLTAERAEKVDAPYIAECPVILECSLSHTVDVGSHALFIGEILDVKANEDCLTEGYPDITKVAPLIYDAGARSYFGVGRRLGQAFSVGNSLIKDS